MAALAHIATAGNTIPTNSEATAQLPLSSVTQNATAVPYSGQHEAVDVRNFLEFMVQADHHPPTTTGTNTEAIPTQNQEPPFFPYKLYEMLEDAELQGFDSIVRWASAPVLGAADDDKEQPGLAFEVCKRQDFLKTILPRYFDLTKYESFRRQLNFYVSENVCRSTVILWHIPFSHVAYLFHHPHHHHHRDSPESHRSRVNAVIAFDMICSDGIIRIFVSILPEPMLEKPVAVVVPLVPRKQQPQRRKLRALSPLRHNNHNETTSTTIRYAAKGEQQSIGLFCYTDLK